MPCTLHPGFLTVLPIALIISLFSQFMEVQLTNKRVIYSVHCDDLKYAYIIIPLIESESQARPHEEPSYHVALVSNLRPHPPVYL